MTHLLNAGTAPVDTYLSLRFDTIPPDDIHAQLDVSGGPNDGQVLFESDGYGEAAGVAFNPPLDLVALGGTGLRFSCGFDNPRSEQVGWGIGDQEMCVIALFADTAMAFQTGVPEGAVTTTSDGIIGHTGDCQVFGFEWDHDKPGGPPR